MKYGLPLCCLILFLLSACGNVSTTETPSPFPIYNFTIATEAPAIITAALSVTNTAIALDPDRIAMGQRRYEALECGSCHGGNARGTALGPALAGTWLTQDQFINVLRTGGKPGMSHQYSTNRLSDEGGKNLYLYLLSLKK